MTTNRGNATDDACGSKLAADVAKNSELYDALKDAIGNRSEYMVMGVLRGVLDDRKDRRAAELNEDGHTDVPSAVRKLKTSMEDAM